MQWAFSEQDLEGDGAGHKAQRRLGRRLLCHRLRLRLQLRLRLRLHSVHCLILGLLCCGRRLCCLGTTGSRRCSRLWCRSVSRR